MTKQFLTISPFSFIMDGDDFVNATNDDLDMALYMLNLQFAPANCTAGGTKKKPLRKGGVRLNSQ